MASLEPDVKLAWKNALRETGAAWVVCGVATASPTPLDGMAGLIDWAVHGQVSALLQRGGLQECCVIPGDPTCARPSFLFVPVDAAISPSHLAETARGLQIGECALAESTFPEDFLSKLKQTLKKAGIGWQKLEPDSG